MRRRKRALIVMFGLFLADTASAAERLSAQEIKAYASGRTFSFGGATFTYGANGAFQVMGSNGLRRGKWGVLGPGLLCIWYDGGGRRCDVIERAGDGTLTFHAHGRGGRFNFIPIR
jgi:hypothetical protein